ncbi:MAG: DUF423 domain-containing protein [Deltaproteobacteria bacterium]|nr:DUF423 domain-containing protein [Deltaproteobacteria bacterium]
MKTGRAFAAACALAFLGVALGAFGAHGLKHIVPPELLTVWETGVRYHLVHALALALVALVRDRGDARLYRIAAWLFAGGIVVFSGSLYALTITGMRIFGAVTPLGGLAFLAGWACLGAGAWKNAGLSP